MVEERKGFIRFAVVTNDGTPQNMIILTGLKCLFQKQLPKMPREYIARLVYDRNSQGMAVVRHGLQVVGGITYRPFPHRGFAEIVFFAIASHYQVNVRRVWNSTWRLQVADMLNIGLRRSFDESLQDVHSSSLSRHRALLDVRGQLRDWVLQEAGKSTVCVILVFARLTRIFRASRRRLHYPDPSGWDTSKIMKAGPSCR